MNNGQCKYCNKVLSVSDLYCPYCGKRQIKDNNLNFRKVISITGVLFSILVFVWIVWPKKSQIPEPISPTPPTTVAITSTKTIGLDYTPTPSVTVTNTPTLTVTKIPVLARLDASVSKNLISKINFTAIGRGAFIIDQKIIVLGNGCNQNGEMSLLALGIKLIPGTITTLGDWVSKEGICLDRIVNGQPDYREITRIDEAYNPETNFYQNSWRNHYISWDNDMVAILASHGLDYVYGRAVAYPIRIYNR